MPALHAAELWRFFCGDPVVAAAGDPIVEHMVGTLKRQRSKAGAALPDHPSAAFSLTPGALSKIHTTLCCCICQELDKQNCSSKPCVLPIHWMLASMGHDGNLTKQLSFDYVNS